MSNQAKPVSEVIAEFKAIAGPNYDHNQPEANYDEGDNAFAIIGACRRALNRKVWKSEETKKAVLDYYDKCFSMSDPLICDYDDLIEFHSELFNG
jgi:hypothetical protein